MISIDEFDDTTLTRIFTNITDWHFGKGFEGSFVRNGKVLFEISMKITDKKICFLEVRQTLFSEALNYETV